MVTSINAESSAPNFIEVPHVELPSMEQVAVGMVNDGIFGNYQTALNWLTSLNIPQEIIDEDEDEECELDSDDEDQSDDESETDEPNSYVSTPTSSTQSQVSNIKITYTGTINDDTWQISTGTLSWSGSIDNTANVHFFKEQMKTQLSLPVFSLILNSLSCTHFQISVELNPLINPSVMVAETMCIGNFVLPTEFTDTISRYAEHIWNIERSIAVLETFGDEIF